MLRSGIKKSKVLVTPSNLKYPPDLLKLDLGELLVLNVYGGQHFAVAIQFSSDGHPLVLYLQHLSILDVLAFLDINAVPVQVRNPSFKPQDCLLQRNVQVDLYIVSLSLHRRVWHLVQLHVHVPRIKVEALFRLSFEQNDISSLHTLFQLELKISGSNYYLFTSANRASLLRSKTSATALSAFHFHFFYCIFDFYLLGHLPSTTAGWARLFDPALIPGPFAMLADFSSSETVDLLSSCVELLEGNPHLGPEVSAFPQGGLLKFFEPGLSMQIVSDSFGDVDQSLVCPFDFYVFLLNVWVAGVAIGVVLD